MSTRQEDYEAMKMENGRGKIEDAVNPSSPVNLPSSILREIVLPEIEKEVNEGKQFALLRQIYVSVILATWFKRNLKESLLGNTYVEKNKIKGIETDDLNAKQKIYEQYLETFKKGVYNFVKEEYDPATQEIVNRQYFSGGVSLSFLGNVPLAKAARDAVMTSMEESLPRSSIVPVILKPLTDAEHQQEIDGAVLMREDDGTRESDFAMLSVLDKFRDPKTFSPIHRMIATIKAPEDRYRESLYALAMLKNDSDIIAVWDEINASYLSLNKTVEGYKNQIVLRSTIAGTIFDQYQKEIEDIHQRNFEWAIVTAELLWPASLRKEKKFVEISEMANGVWQSWQDELDSEADSEDHGQFKRRALLREIVSLRNQRDRLGVGTAERGTVHQQLKNKINQASREMLSESQGRIHHKFAATVYSQTLAQIGKVTNDEEKNKIQEFVRSFMASIEVQNGGTSRFYNGDVNIKWDALFDAIKIGVMTKEQERSLNVIIGEHINKSLTQAEVVDVTKRSLKLSGLAGVLVAGMLLLMPNFKTDVGHQPVVKPAAEVTATEKTDPTPSAQDEQKKQAEREQALQSLLALVKVSENADTLAANALGETTKKERQKQIKALEEKIQTLQAQVQQIEQQEKAAVEEAEVAGRKVHDDFKEQAKSVEKLPSVKKTESSEEQKIIEDESKKKMWQTAPEYTSAPLEGASESLALDLIHIPGKLDQNPVLRDAVMDLGDGDGTHRYDQLKSSGIRAHIKGKHLSIGHYSKIDVDHSKKLVRAPQYRSWKIDRQEKNFEEYIVLNDHGKTTIPVSVPPGYVVANVLTTNTVEKLGVFFDQANGVWVVVTEGLPGELKVGVRPAGILEMPEIQKMEFVDGQGRSIDVEDFLKGVLPPKMFQILELLKDRPRQDQISVLREVMGVFIYSTNPLFNDPLYKGKNVFNTVVKYTASECEGLSFLLAMFDTMLDIHVQVEDGFLVDGNGHQWLLTEYGIEESTSYVAETSSLFDKIGVKRTDWELEMKNLTSKEREMAIDKVFDAILFRLKGEKPKEEMKKLQQEKDQLAAEPEPAKNQVVSGHYMEYQEYYANLLAENEKNLKVLRDTVSISPEAVDQLINQVHSLTVQDQALEKKINNPYQLMAAGRYFFEFLDELNNWLRTDGPSDHEFLKIRQAKAAIYDEIARIAKARGWDLKEPIGPALSSSSFNNVYAHSLVNKNGKMLWRIGELINLDEFNKALSSGELKIIAPGDQSNKVKEVWEDAYTGETFTVERVDPVVEVLGFYPSVALTETGFTVTGSNQDIEIVRYPPGEIASLLLIPQNGKKKWMIVSRGYDTNGAVNDVRKTLTRNSDLEGTYQTVQIHADGKITVVQINGELLITLYNQNTGLNAYAGEFAIKNGLVNIKNGLEDAPLIFADGTFLLAVKNGAEYSFFGSPERMDVLEGNEFRDIDDLTRYGSNQWAAQVTYPDGQVGFVGDLTEGKGPFASHYRYQSIGKLVMNQSGDGFIAAVKDERGWYYIAYNMDGEDVKTLTDPSKRYDYAYTPFIFPDGSVVALVDNRSSFYIGNKQTIQKYFSDKQRMSGGLLVKQKDIWIVHDGGERFGILPNGQYFKILEHINATTATADGYTLGGSWFEAQGSSSTWVYQEVYGPLFRKNDQGELEWIMLVKDDKNLNPAGVDGYKFFGSVAERLGLIGKKFHSARLKENKEGDYWEIDYEVGDDLGGIAEKKYVPEVAPPAHDYLKTTAARAKIASLNLRAEPPVDRFELRWEHFDHLAKLSEQLSNSSHPAKDKTALAARGYFYTLMEDLQYHVQNFKEHYYDMSRAREILTRHRDFITKIFHQQIIAGHVSSRFQDMAHTLYLMGFQDFLVDIVLEVQSKMPEEDVQQYYVDLKNVLSQRQWLEMVENYGRYDRPAASAPYPVTIAPFWVRSEDRDKLKRLQELSRTFLNAEEIRLMDELKIQDQKLEQLIQHMDLIPESERRISSASLGIFMFSFLHERVELGDRLFDVELSGSSTGLIQLLRANTHYLKTGVFSKEWMDYPAKLEKWQEVNQKLNEILGEKFKAAPLNWSDLLGQNLYEVSHDGVALAFLIGLLAAGLSFKNDKLRQQDKIQGLTADQAVDKMLDQMQLTEASDLRALIKSFFKRGEALTPEEEESLKQLRLSLGEQEQAVLDAMLLIAYESPEKAALEGKKRLLHLVPFIGSPFSSYLSNLAFKDRQKMNQELMALVTSFINEERNIDVFYSGLRDIVSRYGSLSKASVVGKQEEVFNLGELMARIYNGSKSEQHVSSLGEEIVSQKNNGAVSTYRGDGTVFDGIREWVPGDPLSAINWTATASMGKLMVNQFLKPVTIPASILIDLRGINAKDSDSINDWVEQLVNSVKILYHDKRVANKGANYTFQGAYFIMPNGKIDFQLPEGIRNNLYSSVIMFIQQHIQKKLENFDFSVPEQASAEGPKAYSDEEKKRYEQRTAVVPLGSNRNGEGLKEQFANVRGQEKKENIFLAGVSEKEREVLDKVLIGAEIFVWRKKNDPRWREAVSLDRLEMEKTLALKPLPTAPIIASISSDEVETPISFQEKLDQATAFSSLVKSVQEQAAKADQAQLSESVIDEHQPKNKENVGGIDLSPELLPLKTTGSGIKYNPRFDSIPWESIPIFGFTPVILEMTPASNFLPFLRVESAPNAEPLAKI